MESVELIDFKPKTKVAFITLVQLYGEPDWYKKPKEGQEKSCIIEQWNDALECFYEADIREACLKFYKFQKGSKSWPTLAHILTQLVGCEKEGRAKKSSSSYLIDADLVPAWKKAMAFLYFCNIVSGNPEYEAEADKIREKVSYPVGQIHAMAEKAYADFEKAKPQIVHSYGDFQAKMVACYVYGGFDAIRKEMSRKMDNPDPFVRKNINPADLTPNFSMSRA